MTDNLPPLLPCPFCGAANPRADTHADDCYFTLHRALNNAPEADLSLTFDVIDAWNRRAALAQAQSLPAGYGGGLVAIKTLLSRDPCTHATTAIAMIEAMLAASPQPQPVQPTTHEFKEWFGGDRHAAPHCGSCGRSRRDPIHSAQAKPEQAAQPHPLSGEQASVMASYFNVPPELVHAVYNRAHGIAAPKPKD